MYTRRKLAHASDTQGVAVENKKRTRSREGFLRHKQRYGEILERRRKLEETRSQRQSNEVVYNRNVYKEPSQIICRYFYRFGKCTKGDNCIFSHDCTPLNSKDLKLCHYFVKAEGCKKTAEECKYSHEVNKFLCRQNVVMGFCNLGPKCQFNHMANEAIKRMDDTEKLKFCYNNKKFLVRSLINMLINGKWVDPHGIGVCDDAKGLSAIVNAYGRIPEQVAKTIPWYLHYTVLILEKDLSLMEEKADSNKQ